MRIALAEKQTGARLELDTEGCSSKTARVSLLGRGLNASALVYLGDTDRPLSAFLSDLLKRRGSERTWSSTEAELTIELFAMRMPWQGEGVAIEVKLSSVDMKNGNWKVQLHLFAGAEELAPFVQDLQELERLLSG